MAHRIALDTEIKTSYCIDQEQRDDQIRIAVDRIKGRLSPSEVLHDEPIALVCYGPSLKKTWPELKHFKKIMTCSGAHQFLLDKGIVPTWHIDLDPREHKVKMLGTPHKDVEYLMSSTCHPAMWDVLEGFNVKLWHIFNNESNRDLPLIYPRGDLIVTGGNNVGLRCLPIARLLGYRMQHVFGMDYSFPKDEGHHAGKHLNANPKLYELNYEGKVYYCEPVMVTYAKQFFHEMKQLPDVRVLLHGEGLLQHMANVKKHENIAPKKHAAIAFSTPITITPAHQEAMRKLHKNPAYGISGKKHKKVVLELAQAMKTSSVLDYGCGKGTLGQALPFPIWEYDPAIPGKENVPRASDLVVCLNVLEHVELTMLDNVLGDLVRCAKKCVFAVIEGTKEQWEKKLHEFFNIGTILPAGKDIHCVLEPRKMGPRG